MLGNIVKLAEFEGKDSTNNETTEEEKRPLRILFATEYLPPFVSGISNRCKNWINGYRRQGHHVTVYSVNGSECDVVVPSIVNPFYEHQRFIQGSEVNLHYRTFIMPPWQLLVELLNFNEPLNYDVCHLVAPLCLAFLPLIPLMWLRGLKIYVSYHVYLEYYRDHYIGDGTTFFSKSVNVLIDFLFPLLYYIPLAFFAEAVGIPSKTADFYVFQYSQRVHLLRSGLDTLVFHPDAAFKFEKKLVPANSSETLIDSAQEGDSLKEIKSVTGDADNEISNLVELAGPGSNLGPILIYAGRLAMEKSIDFLIKAMSNPLLKDATLVIVGDGPIRPNLEDLAQKTVGKEFVYSSNLLVSGLLWNNLTMTGRLIKIQRKTI